jgi:hypothetical protein
MTITGSFDKTLHSGNFAKIYKTHFEDTALLFILEQQPY